MRVLVSPALLLGVLLSGGCSLYLDFDPEGLACDAQGRCRAGYVCNGENECMAEGHPSTLCKPECGPLSVCERASCRPICDGRACEAGSSCVDGACVRNPRELTIGSPCQLPSDCTRAGTTCLLPYGGGAGVCTRVCDSDAECSDGRAPKCVNFPNARGGRKLCADPSFLPCVNEAACNESGLSCGTFALDADVGGDALLEPIAACRPRIEKGAAIGAVCSAELPCANGLCVPINNAGERRCTAPCRDNADCDAVLGKPTEAGASSHACADVVLSPGVGESLPRLRAALCSPNGVSASTPCAPGNSCHADAPYCVPVPGPGSSTVCMTACTDNAVACPITSSPNCIPQADPTRPDVCSP